MTTRRRRRSRSFARGAAAAEKFNMVPLADLAGVIGRVLETGRNSARVLLLTDSESVLPVRRAKDDAEDLDETPKWPSGLDPVKRESLMVLGDLVDLTENARLAGLIK